MSTFNERETAFENKYAHDEETKFKIAARTNKLLGLWAADLMGKTGDDAESYALEVVKSDFEKPGHDDVIEKVAGDFNGEASEDEVRAKRGELLDVAIEQIESGT